MTETEKMGIKRDRMACHGNTAITQAVATAAMTALARQRTIICRQVGVSRMAALLPMAPAQRRIGSSYTHLSYVGGTLMDFSVIAAAVSSINGAIDLGKNALGLSNAAEAKKVVVAMNEKLFDAQQRLFELSSTLNTLQQEKFQTAQELRELREALAERGRYTFVAISDGQFAYRVNPTPALGGTGDPGLTEPDHYVCQKCFDGPTKTKSVLQHQFVGGFAGSFVWQCPTCDMTLRFTNKG